jgi:P27 family predicted phage terminase small subunit
MKGRKSIPTVIKKLQGTDRASRTNDAEPTVMLLHDVPKPPAWLNKYAKYEWVTVATWLQSVGLLASTDESIIAAYCQEMGVYRECQDKLKKPGSRVILTDKGYEMPSAWVTIGNKALMQALKIATEYGLTPSSRSRVQMPTGEENDAFDDAMKSA